MPTRREFLGGAAAAGLSLWLPGVAGARSARAANADVAVIGAGLAGLTCARRLTQAGYSVVVLEAQGRAGGRVLSQDLGGGRVVDLGGESIGPNQGRIANLAGEMGAELFQTTSTADSLLVSTGGRLAFPATAAPPDTGYAAAGAAMDALDKLAAGFPVDTPWLAARAGTWSRSSLASFRDGALDDAGSRAVFDMAARIAFGADPEALSLLTALTAVAGAGDPSTPGSMSRLLATIGGESGERIVGGAQSLARSVADGLRGRVFFNAPVRSVTRIRNRVTVDAGRVQAHVRRVVLAVPPDQVVRMGFIPRLPAAKVQVLQAFRPGTLRKWQAVYDQPFWRDAQLSGQLFAPGGAAEVVFDNTPLEGAPGVLVGFAGGAAAAKTRSAGVLDGLGQAFGSAARNPRQVIEHAWGADRWAQGSPAAFLPGAAWIDRGPALRAQFGLVHFAGAELASYWRGYLDGAVRSGEDAATEVQLAFDRLKTGY